MAQAKIAVALSGGVDSATAASLLLGQGFDVIGLTLRLWREPPESDESEAAATTSPTEGAQQVADALGIPLHVVDAREQFKQCVVDRFIARYAAGYTPNPCLYCNRHVKFGLLLRKAFALGAHRMATGHYARTRLSPGGRTCQLLKGVDVRKDQSYVLYMLGQDELPHILFPLGELTKDEVRALARQRRIPAARAPESQDLCFVPDNDYRRFLRRYAPEAFEPGPILDTSGRVIGQHKGLAAYTIGQRGGIGIAAPEALYALRIDVGRNALIVGPKRELGSTELIAEDVRWVNGGPPDCPVSATVKIRYRARLAEAQVDPLPGARASVRLFEPLRDITPGQGVVFYDGDVVLGGGLITR